MSVTKFDNILKSALWSSYNHICFYCTRPLNWDDIHIDHIIPESISIDKLNFEEIKIRYELDQAFKINAINNLVPTHSKCNLRKSNELFPKQTTLFYLGLTNKNKLKIENEISKLTQRRNRGQIISKVQSAIESGLIGIKEIEGIYKSVRENNWNSTNIKLPSGIEFIDAVYDIFYLNKDYSVLYDKKILLHAIPNYLELAKENGDRIKVSTLREWQNACAAGYNPSTNFAIKISSAFTFLDDFFQAMQKARMPRVSFISEPWLELDDLDYLSPNILHDFEGKLRTYSEKGFSVGDLVRKGIITRSYGGFYKVAFEFEGMETGLIEQFRADFNEDGIEDIFVRGWARATGGTMGYGFTTILTRCSEKHLIDEIYPNYDVRLSERRTKEFSSKFRDLLHKDRLH